jgi:hypothetical protein
LPDTPDAVSTASNNPLRLHTSHKVDIEKRSISTPNNDIKFNLEIFSPCILALHLLDPQETERLLSNGDTDSLSETERATESISLDLDDEDGLLNDPDSPDPDIMPPPSPEAATTAQPKTLKRQFKVQISCVTRRSNLSIKEAMIKNQLIGTFNVIMEQGFHTEPQFYMETTCSARKFVHAAQPYAELLAAGVSVGCRRPCISYLDAKSDTILVYHPVNDKNRLPPPLFSSSTSSTMDTTKFTVNFDIVLDFSHMMVTELTPLPVEAAKTPVEVAKTTAEAATTTSTSAATTTTTKKFNSVRSTTPSATSHLLEGLNKFFWEGARTDPLRTLNRVSELAHEYMLHMDKVQAFDQEQCRTIQGELNRFSDEPVKLVKSVIQVPARQHSTSSSSSVKSRKSKSGTTSSDGRPQFGRKRLSDGDARKKIQQKKKQRRG